MTEHYSYSETCFNGLSWTHNVSKPKQCLTLQQSSTITEHFTALLVFPLCWAIPLAATLPAWLLSDSYNEVLHYQIAVVLLAAFLCTIWICSKPRRTQSAVFIWALIILMLPVYRLYLDSSLAAKCEMMQIICYLSSSDLKAWIHILCRILMQILLLVHQEHWHI